MVVSRVKVEWAATLDVNKAMTIVLDTGENADNRASLGDCSESDVTKIDGLVESLGLTGRVQARQMIRRVKPSCDRLCLFEVYVICRCVFSAFLVFRLSIIVVVRVNACQSVAIFYIKFIAGKRYMWSSSTM